MLTRLDIHNVRNLTQVRLDGLVRTNIFSGANGSGKTSILEAISLLSTARSFRSATARPVINHGGNQLTVYGRIKRDNSFLALGIQRDRGGGADIRVAGATVRSAAHLAAELPVLVLNSDSFDLLTGSPRNRRRFLDWGVFHVEHSFFANWQRFQRCIKQRNTLLRRDRILGEELDSWTFELAAAGESLTKSRETYFARLETCFSQVIETVLPDSAPVSLSFRRGWDRDRDYLEVLRAGLSVDLEHGYTHSGPQRADIRILSGGVSAADTLSRGQQKLVVSALKLAQGHLHAENHMSGECAFLLDDLPSELDDWHLRLVCDEIAHMGAQLFISCIDLPALLSVWRPEAPVSMFHVEHGRIMRIESEQG
ncbi:MAG: DNA replication/repair protein RecF [Chromatocurvus sp.]